MRLVALGTMLGLASLAACDQLFEIASVPDGPDAGGQGDAPVSTAPGCTTTDPNDGFDGGKPCEPWGTYSDNGGAATVNAGTMQITAASGQDSYAGCTGLALVTLPAGGVFLQVKNAFAAPEGYVTFHTYATEAGAAGATFVVSAGQTKLYDESAPDPVASTDYAPGQWWRLRPTANGIAGDVSSDGISWLELGVVPGTLAPVKLDFGGGASATDNPGTAELDNLDLCP